MIVNGNKKGQVTFVCDFRRHAKRVFLVGEFNDWDPSATKMVRSRNGSFRVTLNLPAGRHEYKFVVDGEWVTDPAVESLTTPFGTVNNVLHIM